MSLTVITGCMFSGKSSYLINNLNNNNVYYINSILDTRTTDFIETHDGNKIKAYKRDNLYFTDEELCEIKNKYNSIAIDEGQFFPELKINVERLLEYGFNIYVAGLDADSNQEKFGEILDLILIADKTIKLYGICHICKQDGTFTKRINKIFTQQILIGNSNKFQCVCRKHLKI